MGSVPPALTESNARTGSIGGTPTGIRQPMWVLGICGGRGLGDFRPLRLVGGSSAVNKRSHDRRTSENPSDLPLSGEGARPEPLARAQLAAGETVPGDRLYAIENGPSGFDPAAPRLSAQAALPDADEERAAGALRSRYDDASHTLVIDYDGREAVRGDLRTPAGRAAIEQFFAEFCAADLRGPPKVLHAPGFSFSDVARKVVSIINLASVAALEDVVGGAGRSAAFSRQRLCDRLAGLARVRSARAGDRGRRCAAQDRQAHRALRRDQCRSGHRHPRPVDPGSADAELRPCRLRRLWRGGGGARRDRGGGCEYAAEPRSEALRTRHANGALSPLRSVLVRLKRAARRSSRRRLSRNTACSPNRFQNHHGALRRSARPQALSATAFSILAPTTWQSWRKSLMVQKWMLGVSYQA